MHKPHQKQQAWLPWQIKFSDCSKFTFNVASGPPSSHYHQGGQLINILFYIGVVMWLMTSQELVIGWYIWTAMLGLSSESIPPIASSWSWRLTAVELFTGRSATLFHGLRCLCWIVLVCWQDTFIATWSHGVKEENLMSRSTLNLKHFFHCNSPADRADHHRVLVMRVSMVEVDQEQCATLQSQCSEL